MSTPTTTSNLASVLADLSAEGVDLDALVSADGVDLTSPTPAPGWTIAHQLGHLRWTDELTVLSCEDPTAFAAIGSSLRTEGDLAAAVEDGARQGAATPGPELLATWRTGRAVVLDALCRVPSGTRLAWIGPPMGAGTMASARMMETWAHGQDIADALGVVRVPSDRLRHVAELGVRTRDHAFRTNRLPVPLRPFRVELIAPSGAQWCWGPDDADERVTGPALDFALLVTQRRHPDDLALIADGPLAQHWLTIAQAFAGAPGAGRTAGAHTLSRS